MLVPMRPSPVPPMFKTRMTVARVGEMAAGAAASFVARCATGAAEGAGAVSEATDATGDGPAPETPLLPSTAAGSGLALDIALELFAGVEAVGLP